VLDLRCNENIRRRRKR